MLLRSVIEKLNENLTGLVDGIKTFGLAQSVIRTVGSDEEMFPGVIGKDGEIEYVGIDFDDKVRLYHRNAGITTSRSTQQAFGDSFSDVVNTYQMAMIVAIDHKRSNLYPEDLFLLIQANIPDRVDGISDYKSVYLNTTNVIMNSQLVFAAEYAGVDIKLPAEKSLFQINYTIQSTFKKDCFKKCPEGCS